MRGGNRTNRKSYSKESIKHLVQDYKQKQVRYYNPVTKKVYDTHKLWFTNLVYWMDKPSVNHFLFLLEEPHYSLYSGILLTEDSFSYSGTFKGWTGWKKYTPSEIKQRVWTKLRDYTKTESEIEKIRKTLKQYNKTDAGIAQRNKKSKRMKKFYETEEGKQHKKMCSKKMSRTMKRKIASGEYTPNITNTWTHWDAKIVIGETTKKFRSSWEACFWLCNQHCEYETIRVKTDVKTYISDFYDPETRTMYEIKPKNRYNIEIDKMTALQEYCDQNEMSFKWINEENIIQYIDETKFEDDNLLQLKMMRKAYAKIKD
jgi:hypothetical protein